MENENVVRSRHSTFNMQELTLMYVTDAQVMVARMHAFVTNWVEFSQRGPGRKEVRRIAHQFRGSGKTYGFSTVTRVGKAMELILEKLDDGIIQPDQRLQQSLISKIEKLGIAFRREII